MVFQSILVPTDFSENSRQALNYALFFAAHQGTVLHILHVVDSRVLDISAMSGDVREKYRAELERDMHSFIEQASSETVDIKARMSEDFHVPFVAIVEEANQLGVDLICMGTHGRTGITHALLGSTTEKVVRKAPCPVLTVRLADHEFVHP